MRLLVTVVAVAALLAGCGGQPDVIEPKPGESPSVSTSQATAPKLSDQANEDSDEGAVAAASHWVDLLNYATVTGDTSELEAYSSECGPCMQLTRNARGLNQSERPVENVWSISGAEVVRDDVSADVKFDIDVLGEGTSVVAFELTPSPPFKISDLYRVEPS